MKKSLYFLLLLLVVSACSTLTKSQVESINQFGETSSEFSAYPGKIMTELSEIRVKRGLFYASTLTDASLHIAELDSIYNQKEFDYRVSQKVDITFKIIDEYAQSLILLSSEEPSENIALHGGNLGVGIDSLISLYNTVDNSASLPTGIGNTIHSLSLAGGRQFVRRKQAAEIKKYVSEADPLIAVMTSNLLEYLDSSVIEDLIRHEEMMIRRDFLTYLQHQDKKPFQAQKDYLELRNSLEKTKLLRKQSINATTNLREAHGKLLQIIRKKQDLKHIVKELQIFRGQVNAIRKTIRKIDTVKG